MKRKHSIIVALYLTLCISCAPVSDTLQNDPVVSGVMDVGVRVLDLDVQEEGAFTVYQGDYIRFRSQKALAAEIVWRGSGHPEKKSSAKQGTVALFQALTPGQYSFAVGSVQGHIRVVEQKTPQYWKITPLEAQCLINQVQPLILDVRNQDEFDDEHIKNALLIPIWALGQRLDELHDWKEKDILVYCATGRRSSRAAKLLLKNGFKRVYNMKSGIYGWDDNDLPLVP